MRKKIRDKLERHTKKAARAKRRAEAAKDALNKRAVDKGDIIPLEASKTKPAVTVYVGHLPQSFSELELTRFCDQFKGLVGVRCARNPVTGASRGYAFVQFSTPLAAEQAAKELNGYLISRRRLKANVVALPDRALRMFRSTEYRAKKARAVTMARLAAGGGPNVTVRPRAAGEDEPAVPSQLRRASRLAASVASLEALGLAVPSALAKSSASADAVAKAVPAATPRDADPAAAAAAKLAKGGKAKPAKAAPAKGAKPAKPAKPAAPKAEAPAKAPAAVPVKKVETAPVKAPVVAKAAAATKKAAAPAVAAKGKAKAKAK